ncbi:hypothetical protein B9G69_009755 [Bdellovibrio sp. SKB1291214]|uniref:hypothetical protein n=1 Tax=Bdellovibrio sp. SKB1291214 TaxID=1732569 RepID=UPI000B5151AD|nr:hypothetical protein [Bdellovibrio sp. SKB1291214]UYL07330.1 hypothetical protein B9G69_009755 [Bdellovibrio sp. SKB1291214]
MKTAVLLFLLPLSSFASDKCPLNAEISAYQKETKIMSERNVQAFTEKFTKLCEIADKAYTCKVDRLKADEIEALKKTSLGSCDFRTWLPDRGWYATFQFIQK